MKVPAEIFRAYDSRGIAGKTLTPDVVRAVGRALGSMASDFAVGRDGRASGRQLVDALCEGLQASGASVVDIGMAPTPVVYFAAHHLGCGSCVAVTGSHNPPEYNGLKMVVDGHTLSGDEIQQLRARIEKEDFRSGAGARRAAEVIPAYVERITSDVRGSRRMPAGATSERMLRELNDALEALQEPLPVVFGHNDLLPANFLDDGDRLWLIDFEYAGFNTAMFDLAGAASNAGMTTADSAGLLAEYFGREPDQDLLRSHSGMQCASLLREAMWSMVSELHLAAPGADYEAYTAENLTRLEQSVTERQRIADARIALIGELRKAHGKLAEKMIPIADDVAFTLAMALETAADGQDPATIHKTLMGLADNELGALQAVLALRAESNLTLGILVEAADLATADLLPPVKRAVMRQNLGFAGGTPAAARK